MKTSLARIGLAVLGLLWMVALVPLFQEPVSAEEEAPTILNLEGILPYEPPIEGCDLGQISTLTDEEYAEFDPRQEGLGQYQVGVMCSAYVQASQLPETALARMAVILQTDRDSLTAVIFEGKDIDTGLFREGAAAADKIVDGMTQLQRICTPEESDTDKITNSDRVECREQILLMYEREREHLRNEQLLTQMALQANRYLDGMRSNLADWDILEDLCRIDILLVGTSGERGKCDGNLIVQAAERDVLQGLDDPQSAPDDLSGLIENPMEAFRQILTDGDLRLPEDLALPFGPRGDCPVGERSMFGGLFCAPKFCIDFVCVEIRSDVGRAAQEREIFFTELPVGGVYEKTALNLLKGISQVLTEIDGQRQLTPTRNTNEGFFMSQIWNWVTDLKRNIVFEFRTPQILREISQYERTTYQPYCPAGSTDCTPPPTPSSRGANTAELEESDDGSSVTVRNISTEPGLPPQEAATKADGTEIGENVFRNEQRIRTVMSEVQEERGLCPGRGQSCRSVHIAYQLILPQCITDTGATNLSTLGESANRCIGLALENAGDVTLLPLQQDDLAQLQVIQSERKELYRSFISLITAYREDLKHYQEALELFSIEKTRKAVESCAARQG